MWKIKESNIPLIPLMNGNIRLKALIDVQSLMKDKPSILTSFEVVNEIKTTTPNIL